MDYYSDIVYREAWEELQTLRQGTQSVKDFYILVRSLLFRTKQLHETWRIEYYFMTGVNVAIKKRLWDIDFISPSHMYELALQAEGDIREERRRQQRIKEEKKRLQQREAKFQSRWCSSFAQKIQDYVIGCELLIDIFDFALLSQKEECMIEESLPKTNEPIVEESIFEAQVQEIVPIVEVPLLEVVPKISKQSPPLQIEHVDFIFGDFFDKQADGPKVQDFLPQFKLPVFYFRAMIRGRIIFQLGGNDRTTSGPLCIVPNHDDHGIVMGNYVISVFLELMDDGRLVPKLEGEVSAKG